jgi:hypothetical protein
MTAEQVESVIEISVRRARGERLTRQEFVEMAETEVVEKDVVLIPKGREDWISTWIS